MPEARHAYYGLKGSAMLCLRAKRREEKPQKAMLERKATHSETVDAFLVWTLLYHLNDAIETSFATCTDSFARHGL